jgi:Protein of unknown function (DUF1552)
MPRLRPISRRMLLTGTAGTAIALPFLEAMLPRSARAADAAIPKRLLVWTTPNGVVIDNWVCAQGPGGPTDFELSPILAPLAAHKADMVVLQNLEQANSYGHHCIGSLTGRAALDVGFPNLTATGISLDQYLAGKWAGLAPIPSLQLGVCITQNRETVACIAWNADLQPQPAENNPFAAFARLFPNGSGEPNADLERVIAARMSILDSAKDQTQALVGRVGHSDKIVLQNYFDSLREVEQQLADLQEKAEACGAPVFPAAPAPEDTWWLSNERVPDVIDLHSDLIAIAFACDLTRIITLNLANDGGAYRTFPYIDGVDSTNDWHGWSHQVEAGNRETLTAIDTWHNGKLAALIDRLKAAPDPDGNSVLHNAIVMTNNEYGPNGPVDYLGLPPGSDVPNNLSHYTVTMPYVLIGHAGGQLETGRNLVFPLKNETDGSGHGIHSTRLLVSLLQLLGEPDESFGDPTFDQGPLDELVG